MTAVQTALDLPVVAPDYAPGMTLDEQFDAWAEVNPHVIDACEEQAAQWLARHRAVGVKAIFETLRWQSGVSERGTVWKLDNRWTSRIARVLLDRHPEWVGRIRTRALAAERGT